MTLSSSDMEVFLTLVKYFLPLCNVGRSSVLVVMGGLYLSLDFIVIVIIIIIIIIIITIIIINRENDYHY